MSNAGSWRGARLARPARPRLTRLSPPAARQRARRGVLSTRVRLARHRSGLKRMNSLGGGDRRSGDPQQPDVWAAGRSRARRSRPHIRAASFAGSGVAPDRLRARRERRPPVRSAVAAGSRPPPTGAASRSRRPAHRIRKARRCVPLAIEAVGEQEIERTLVLPAVVEAVPGGQVLPPLAGRVTQLKVDGSRSSSGSRSSFSTRPISVPRMPSMIAPK